MKQFEQHIKHLTFLGIIGLLIIPLFQSKFKFIEDKPLNGDAVLTAEDSYISIDRWLDGVYQFEQEAYLNENTGFRSDFIRFYNQWNFSLYNKVRAKSVVVGKDGYLFEENYIKAYNGTDYLGKDSVAQIIGKLAVIRDSLSKSGVELVVLLAPGKASFYPEFIPDKLKSKEKRPTNSDAFKEQLKLKGIHTLDAHSWFLDMKSTVHKEHKLYSKTGIHWSKYGEYLVGDSLVKLLSTITGKDLPNFKVTSSYKTKHLKAGDDDIYRGLNIIERLEDFEMTYPKLSINTENKTPIKAVTIADSYYWGLFDSQMSHKIFSDGEFWFYFENRYPNFFYDPAGAKVKDANLKEELLKNEVVLIICTDANLPKFGFGFIDRFYQELIHPIK